MQKKFFYTILALFLILSSLACNKRPTIDGPEDASHVNPSEKAIDGEVIPYLRVGRLLKIDDSLYLVVNNYPPANETTSLIRINEKGINVVIDEAGFTGWLYPSLGKFNVVVYRYDTNEERDIAEYLYNPLDESLEETTNAINPIAVIDGKELHYKYEDVFTLYVDQQKVATFDNYLQFNVGKKRVLYTDFSAKKYGIYDFDLTSNKESLLIPVKSKLVNRRHYWYRTKQIVCFATAGDTVAYILQTRRISRNAMKDGEIIKQKLVIYNLQSKTSKTFPLSSSMHLPYDNEGEDEFHVFDGGVLLLIDFPEEDDLDPRSGLYVYDFDTNELLRVIEGNNEIRDFTFHQEDIYFLSGNICYKYNHATKEVIHVFSNPQSDIADKDTFFTLDYYIFDDKWIYFTVYSEQYAEYGNPQLYRVNQKDLTVQHLDYMNWDS